jgi:hypothetical protein
MAEIITIITWGSKVGFGKYADLSLIALKIKDPKYLKWCYETELHISRPTIAFIFENIKEKEFDEIMR